MGSLKNQKDKVVGNAKEKIGEMLNKENLIDEVVRNQKQQKKKKSSTKQESMK